jgi:hypothetical protein
VTNTVEVKVAKFDVNFDKICLKSSGNIYTIKDHLPETNSVSLAQKKPKIPLGKPKGILYPLFVIFLLHLAKIGAKNLLLTRELLHQNVYKTIS